MKLFLENAFSALAQMLLSFLVLHLPNLLQTIQIIVLLGIRGKMYFVIAAEIFYACLGLNNVLS